MPLTMPKIFISYRRSDSQHITDHIATYLTNTFDEQSIYKDADIQGGANWRGWIREKTATCDVMLVVIGPDWLDELQERQKSEADDWVKYEVATGLDRGIQVIPLLVKGASMPTSADLPDELKGLSARNALPVRGGSDFDNDMKRVISAISNKKKSWTSRLEWKWIIGVIMIPIIVALIPVIFDNKGNVTTPTQTETPTQLAQSVTDTPTPSVTTDIALTPTLTFTPEVTPPSQTATDESTLAPNGINLESELTEASLLAWWTSNGCTPLVSNEILDNLARGHMTDLRRRDFIELTSEPTLAYLSSANQTIQQVATIFSPPYRQPLSLVVLIKQDIINVGDFVDELGLVVGGAINCNYTQYGISHESSLVSGHHYFVVLLGMSN